MAPPKKAGATPRKRAHRIDSSDDDEPAPAVPVTGPEAPATDPPASHPDDGQQPGGSGLQKNQEEEELKLWDFFVKDPKFTKPKADDAKKYADAICTKCDMPIPRSLASTTGMWAHLEHHHPATFVKLQKQQIEANRQKVWTTVLCIVDFYVSSPRVFHSHSDFSELL